MGYQLANIIKGFRLAYQPFRPCSSVAVVFVLRLGLGDGSLSVFYFCLPTSCQVMAVQRVVDELQNLGDEVRRRSLLLC